MNSSQAKQQQGQVMLQHSSGSWSQPMGMQQLVMLGSSSSQQGLAVGAWGFLMRQEPKVRAAAVHMACTPWFTSGIAHAQACSALLQPFLCLLLAIITQF